jgi:hypothetical protein
MQFLNLVLTIFLVQDELDAISSFLSVMQQQRDSASVQALACKTLGLLAESGDAVDKTCV